MRPIELTPARARRGCPRCRPRTPDGRRVVSTYLPTGREIAEAPELRWQAQAPTVVLRAVQGDEAAGEPTQVRPGQADAGRGVMPPCAGRSDIFDSTRPSDHLEAVALCHTCPIIDACRALLDDTRREWGYDENNGPRGTWAGEFLGKKSLRTRDPRRVATEDAMFTDETARQAHAAFVAGARTDWARLGERYYQRQRARRRREAARMETA